MDAQVVVWNLDARNRPELDVEIEIIYQPGELPGLHYARARPDLEVEIEMVVADEIVDLTAFARLVVPAPVPVAQIVDRPPQGYAAAFRRAAG